MQILGGGNDFHFLTTGYIYPPSEFLFLWTMFPEFWKTWRNLNPLIFDSGEIDSHQEKKKKKAVKTVINNRSSTAGKLYYLWTISFIINFVYYSYVIYAVMQKWREMNSIYVWKNKDRRKSEQNSNTWVNDKTYVNM